MYELTSQPRRHAVVSFPDVDPGFVVTNDVSVEGFLLGRLLLPDLFCSVWDVD